MGKGLVEEQKGQWNGIQEQLKASIVPLFCSVLFLCSTIYI